MSNNSIHKVSSYSLVLVKHILTPHSTAWFKSRVYGGDDINKNALFYCGCYFWSSNL